MAGYVSVNDWLREIAGFDPPKVELAGGTAAIGKVEVDQTTPGTTDSVTVKAAAGVGSLIETAPATDTASSGLNGRLQRIAQRLTSLIALLPTALGQAAMAASLPVVIASDQSAVPVSLATTPALESTTVVEYNVTLTNADTQYSQALPANTRRLCFRCRSGVAIRYAWITDKVATPTAPYQSLQAGAEYALDGVLLAGSTLYFASGAAGAVVEMEAWS